MLRVPASRPCRSGSQFRSSACCLPPIMPPVRQPVISVRVHRVWPLYMHPAARSRIAKDYLPGSLAETSGAGHVVTRSIMTGLTVAGHFVARLPLA